MHLRDVAELLQALAAIVLAGVAAKRAARPRKGPRVRQQKDR